MNTVEGTWRSHYEYDKGPDNEPQTSEHQIELTWQDDVWVGTSAPQEDGSEITLILRQTGDEFRGEWQEHTSPTGSYGGREFGGAVLLLLLNDGNELNGMWIGVNSDNSRVKSGSWTLERISRQS